MRKKDGRNVSRSPSPRRPPPLIRQNAVRISSPNQNSIQQSQVINRRMPFQSPLRIRRQRSQSTRRSQSPRRRSQSPRRRRSPRRSQ